MGEAVMRLAWLHVISPQPEEKKIAAALCVLEDLRAQISLVYHLVFLVQQHSGEYNAISQLLASFSCFWIVCSLIEAKHFSENSTTEAFLNKKETSCCEAGVIKLIES